uniref:SMP-30/gluconolactonase/LRE family protein n=1 Tax=Roseovarius indicus TaxID=540747 RepID=UPI003B521D23
MFTSPQYFVADVFTTLPEDLRVRERSQWADVQKHGAELGSFLEGPVADAFGALYVTDIPYGRIFRVTVDGTFELVARYDGEPNGLAMHPDGQLFIADHKHGILALRPETGEFVTVIDRVRLERFRGVNDLTFDSKGNLWFTDQGQSGLQEPNGRVYRLSPDGDLSLFLANIPSPNGLVLDLEERHLLLAVTRANQIWRAPILQDGETSKVGAFINLSGGFGPDGMALDAEGGFVSCQPGLGRVYWFDRDGDLRGVVQSSTGRVVTNCCFGGNDGKTLFITEADTGNILSCTLPVAGHMLYHQR